MHKKKVQHKGKPKHATTESEDFAFRKRETENTEEEYVTIANLDTSKYKPRIFESNWAKYETSLTDTDSGDEPKTNDFNYLLKTASSDCSHFEFNSEKLWKSESSSVVSSKVFDLDLNVLSSGLACVPFYERIGLDVKDLSEEDKKRFDEEAENNRKQYDLLLGKSVAKPEDESKDKSVEINKKKDDKAESTSKEEIKTCKEENKSKVEQPKKKEKNNLLDPDENLEDWLDSILDD